MWRFRKGCGILGSREEKRPFAKFSAWRWNTIKMDLVKLGVDLVHGVQIRIQWQVLVKTLLKGGKLLLDHLGDRQFLRTLSLEAISLHTRARARALARTSSFLSFGEAEVCVCCRLGRCVFRPRIWYVTLRRKPPGCYLFKINFSSFPRAVKVGQPSDSAVYKLLQLGSLFMLTFLITAWILLTLQTLLYKIHTVTMQEITNFPRFQLSMIYSI